MSGSCNRLSEKSVQWNSAPLRSNRLLFLFGGTDFPNGIVPNGYHEILMHVDAKRRAAVEGPLDEEVDGILSQIQAFK